MFNMYSVLYVLKLFGSKFYLPAWVCLKSVHILPGISWYIFGLKRTRYTKTKAIKIGNVADFYASMPITS